MRANGKEGLRVHHDLNRIASMVNDHHGNKTLLAEVHEHIHLLKKHALSDAIYFPKVLVTGRLVLFCCIILKSLWWIFGGLIWRGVRAFVFSKIKHDTFQGPTSLGAAMVVFPLVSLVFLLMSWLLAWPLWWIPIWWTLLIAGKLIPTPLSLLWSVFVLPRGVKRKLEKNVKHFDAKISG
jgi:hypothetical protein